ncbi:MAG: UvrD-helicase domain-containing protein, partial [Bacteroidales bacterium]|nr:UvrD-helicase domain-containing protein [Bacteroidales bacterium]
NCQLQELVNIYTIYNTRCFNSQAMDFDDLLFNMYLLLDGYAEVLLKYQHRFTYILVDEYQDTNRVQYMILKKLAAARRNICVVGDDAQSIYSFRGANIENILNFQKDYPDAQTFKMEQNYRSTKNIVNAANSVIHKNKRQIYKQVWTENESGVKINIIKAQSDSDEASSIANSIFETKMNHQLPNSDFAILYRTNAQSRALEDALRKLNIPYRIFGAISFYRRKEIKDLLAYFRLVINQDDDQSLLRIINYPARGIGKTTIDKLTEVAAQRNLSLWKAIYSDNNGLTPNTINKIKDFCILIMNFVKQLGDIDAYTLARNIAIGTGLTRELSEDKTPEGISKYENIEELLNAINEFTEDNAEIPDEEGNFDLPTLDKYMENIALLTDADKNDKDDINRVSLMTVHAAKGLEFKYVYITGLEEKLFPSGMSIDTPQGVEEERRLFYVAITRAQVKVTLSHCQHRYRWGEFTFCSPSRFIREIDPKFLDIVEKDIVQEESFYSSKPLLNTNTKLKSLKELSENKVVDNENIDDKIQTGMEVEHIRFGKGKIISMEGNGVNRKATVFFHDHGNKQLILKFAKLKIIND